MANHLIEALLAAHAALDLITQRDARGRHVGWVELAGTGTAELAEAVRLQAELEGRVAGLRLHAVAAADAAGAAQVGAETDTTSWATGFPGVRADRPTSTTRHRCAGPTTDASTTSSTNMSGSRTGPSGSDIAGPAGGIGMSRHG